MQAQTKKWAGITLVLGAAITALIIGSNAYLDASSHREAPLIANDPQADNTDLYAFRSPDDTNTVTLIANYIPAELPHGGPNYFTFGEDVRYQIHIKNDPNTPGDDIIYRFEFKQVNQDPTTFFNIRLGQQNLKNTYDCIRTIDGGQHWVKIVTNGVVPPNNIGPRSIQSPVGLNAPDYNTLRMNAITTATTGEKVFCGPSDDPFFVDLGGVFDLGQTRGNGGARDGLSCKNTHSICVKVPISTLQKDGKNTTMAANILDPDFVIGVYATANRRRVTVRSLTGEKPLNNGIWVQVSRLGMPLTNEVVMPIGKKDYWNSLKPYNEDTALEKYFTNPELALYMDDALFGGAVPALSNLRIQRNSLQSFDFGNGQNGLSGLLGNPATIGTAFDQNLFGNYLLRPGQPRSVDLLPIFMTGVPNLSPYQLATGKGGNPLAAGKPFIHNFLPTFGDMLRLNMAVPITPRNHPKFSSLGLVQAAVLGLTDPMYNGNTNLEWIPNMDGFPNGRRLEDDVTRIELQAVGGVVLAAVGLWYDDYTAGGPNPVTQDLVDVLTYTTGVESNDRKFKMSFPYLANPFSGFGECGGALAMSSNRLYPGMDNNMKLTSPEVFMDVYPNPAKNITNIKYRVKTRTQVSLRITDGAGNLIATPFTGKSAEAGTHEFVYNTSNLKPGTYFALLNNYDELVQSIKFTVIK
ncbi:MAG: DUF4331 family protein [Bacteroidetes bacterium]|nr:DUF4331 family protein [Bacteroidota bacterium]